MTELARALFWFLGFPAKVIRTEVHSLGRLCKEALPEISETGSSDLMLLL